MVGEGAPPSRIDAFRPGPRPNIPRPLRDSFRLWLLAVAAGLFETALVVADATDGEIGSAAQVTVGVAVRLLVFTAAVYLAAQLRQGKQWARVALAVGLGGIGTLSLVIGPVTWLAEGGSLADTAAAADLGSVLFAASRVVHLGGGHRGPDLDVPPGRQRLHPNNHTRSRAARATAGRGRRRSQLITQPNTQPCPGSTSPVTHQEMDRCPAGCGLTDHLACQTDRQRRPTRLGHLHASAMCEP
jgi:hypothetical protein